MLDTVYVQYAMHQISYGYPVTIQWDKATFYSLYLFHLGELDKMHLMLFTGHQGMYSKDILYSKVNSFSF